MVTTEQVNAELNWPEWDVNSAILRDLSAWLTPQVAEHCEWDAEEYAEEQHPETIAARQALVIERVITPPVVAAAVQYARYLTFERPYPCTPEEAARYAADHVAQIIADQCGVYWPARNALLAAVMPLLEPESPM